MSHTTSRVLQAAAKAAGPKARANALSEVSPDLLTLAKSSYGHFLAAKLIALAPKQEFPGKKRLVKVILYRRRCFLAAAENKRKRRKNKFCRRCFLPI